MAQKAEIIKRSREELVTLSEWAEKCERWENMVDWTKQFSRIGKEELDIKERMLVATSFKHFTGTRRAAWRVLSSIQKKENNKGSQENVSWIK